MELRHLRYFIAAVEEGSLQAAAQRANISQPALSRRIQDMEQELGCMLLLRSARGVTPTPAGSALYRKALGVMEDFDDTCQTARLVGREQASHARFGLVPTSRKLQFVTDALSAYYARHPSHALSLMCGPSYQQFSALREGRLDLTLLYERHVDSRDLHERPIHRERYVMALHPDHPLAIPEPAKLDDFAGIPLVWLSRHEYGLGQDLLMQQCRLHGFDPVIAQLARNFEQQMDLVCATGGACFTSALTALSVPAGSLVFRPLPSFTAEMNLSLAWSADLNGSAQDLLTELHRVIDLHQAEIEAGAGAWIRVHGHRIVRVPSPPAEFPLTS